MAAMGWKRRFDDPIPLPRGRQFVTLQDAADYFLKLPKAEQNLVEWQTATASLIGAAESSDFTVHARIGILRALSVRPATASTSGISRIVLAEALTARNRHHRPSAPSMVAHRRWRIIAWFARSRPLGRIAADLGF
jgi:hypothetical protein